MLILSSEFPPGPGGIGTHAYHVANQLHRRGWNVSVAANQELASPDAISAFNRTTPFPVHHLAQYPGMATKLAYRSTMFSRLVNRVRPDLVVATGERMVWIAAVRHAIRATPYVAIGHAMEFNAPARWIRTFNRFSFEAARGVVCVSEYTRSRMHASGIRASTSTVIPNGADETRFFPVAPAEAAAFRREHRLESATIVLTVGSVHERKGQDVVIRALPRILGRYPNVQYVSVGPPFREEAFSKLAASLGVAEHVRFLGALEQTDVVRALSAADLFVMTSQHTPDGDFEGYGIAVVEAALCGCPAVVSDNSGLPEAIEPEETGLVAEISNPASTAARIVELLSDRKRLARMGTLARERALRDKTWDRRGEQYDRFLRSLVR